MPSGSPWIPVSLDYPGVDDNPFVESRLSLVKRISLEIKPRFSTIHVLCHSTLTDLKLKLSRVKVVDAMNDTFVKNGERIDPKFSLYLSLSKLVKKLNERKWKPYSSSFLLNFPYNWTTKLVGKSNIDWISSCERIRIFPFVTNDREIRCLLVESLT